MMATLLVVGGIVLEAMGWTRWEGRPVPMGVGAAAVVAGVLGWAGAPGIVQVGVAVGGGVVLAGLFWRWTSLVAQGSNLPSGVGAVRLRGRVGHVVAAIGPDSDATGIVAVDGDTWRARTDDDVELAIGSRVVVVDLRGTSVLVRRAPDPSPSPSAPGPSASRPAPGPSASRPAPGSSASPPAPGTSASPPASGPSAAPPAPDPAASPWPPDPSASPSAPGPSAAPTSTSPQSTSPTSTPSPTER